MYARSEEQATYLYTDFVYQCYEEEFERANASRSIVKLITQYKFSSVVAISFGHQSSTNPFDVQSMAENLLLSRFRVRYCTCVRW